MPYVLEGMAWGHSLWPYKVQIIMFAWFVHKLLYFVSLWPCKVQMLVQNKMYFVHKMICLSEMYKSGGLIHTFLTDKLFAYKIHHCTVSTTHPFYFIEYYVMCWSSLRLPYCSPHWWGSLVVVFYTLMKTSQHASLQINEFPCCPFTHDEPCSNNMLHSMLQCPLHIRGNKLMCSRYLVAVQPNIYCTSVCYLQCAVGIQA